MDVNIKISFCEHFLKLVKNYENDLEFIEFLKFNPFPTLSVLQTNEILIQKCSPIDIYVVENNNWLINIERITKIFFENYKEKLPFLLFTNLFLRFFSPITKYFSKKNKLDLIEELRKQAYQSK